MLISTSTFPSDLGISTRVGLTKGAGHPIGAIDSFAQAQSRYREERLEARRLARSQRRPLLTWASVRSGVTRWATWHSSDQRPSSSAACSNSVGSAS